MGRRAGLGWNGGGKARTGEGVPLPKHNCRTEGQAPFSELPGLGMKERECTHWRNSRNSKGSLQSKAQMHSLTENSRLTAALQRQHKAGGALGPRDYLSGLTLPQSKRKGREEAEATGSPLAVFLIPSLLGNSGV